MSYTPNYLVKLLKGEKIDRRTAIIGALEGVGLLKSLDAIAQFAPSPAYAQASTKTHMDHVRAMEGRSDKERGQYVIDALKSLGLEHRVENYRVALSEGFNVIFETGSGQRTIVFTSHYDVVPSSPGANDDASCVAVALTSYQELIKQELKNVRVRFIVFGHEEINAAGSQHYVKSASNLENVVGVYSLELCGIGDTIFAWDVVNPELTNSEMMKVLQTVLKNKGIPLEIRGIVRTHGNARNYSDHVSFMGKGVNGFGLSVLPKDNTRGVFTLYHTPFDKSSTLDPKAMQRMQDVVIGIANEFNESK